VDWCCLPRFDSDSCFGRLLDWRQGGHFSITPSGKTEVSREYLPNTLVLATTFRSGRNVARVIDFFSMRIGGREEPRRELVRIIEGVKGKMTFDVNVVARFDYGDVKPWVFSGGRHAHFAVGSDTGIRIFGDVEFDIVDSHDLHTQVQVSPRKKVHIGLQFFRPEEANARRERGKPARQLQAHLKETLRWWHNWSKKIAYHDGPGVNIVRSAITLKALTYAPTGAIVAAPTTSLPEREGGERNWDYRFCWIRDSIFTVWALNAVGAVSEAEGVRHFIQRASSGNAEDLQVLYGVDGKRRLTEIELDYLEGWRGSKPVRIGNGASRQYQADMYGLLVEFAWQWDQLGHQPTPAYWKFISQLVEAAIAKWRLADRGIWEVRSRPLHFVHSKVMCWAAANRGVALAETYGLPAPLGKWRAARDEIRAAIDKRGVDHERGIYVRSFGSRDVDSALLLLPIVGYVAYDDERMVRTMQVISKELMQDGLLLRYRRDDGLEGAEGVFLACTFWLVACLARAGRKQQASRIYKRAIATGNDLGLFAEEYSRRGRQMLGNFPQGLSHLSHIGAALALMNVRQPRN